MLNSVFRAIRSRAINAYSSLRQGKHLWLGLAIAVLSWFVGDYLAQLTNKPWSHADSIRWMGLLFQVVGIGYVVHGLDESRALFGRPTMVRSLLAWITEFRFVFISRPAKSLSINVPMGNFSMKGYAAALFVSGGTVEERIGRLEQSFRTLQTDVSKNLQFVEDLETKLRKEIRHESTERKIGDSASKRVVEDAVVGGIQFELGGVIFFTLGSVASTIPAELAKWAFG